MQQFTLDVGIDLRPSLDNFLPLGNESAHQHVRLWLGTDTSSTAQRSPVPMYFWGEAGSGKTHVLQAIGNALRDRGEGIGVLRGGTMEPRPFDPAWRVVLLDDVHEYNAVQQHAAFNWFVHAQAASCTVIAAGSVPPAQLLLREDLRTRLGWGDVFALHVLPEAGQRQVLLNSASARGLQLSGDVLDYMVTRFSRDLSHLMAWLDKLDRYALQTKRAITLPLLKDMLDNFDRLL